MEESRTATKKTFFSGVLLLGLSTVLVKAVGLFYKLFLLSALGSVGMGYFNSAYEIYILFCVIATAGLPVALSVLISSALAKGKNQEAQKIFQTAFVIFFIIGTVGSLSMFAFAPIFCHWIRSPKAYASILTIAPTVLPVCLSAAYRGYFQGCQKMLPTAVSQVLESVGKLLFGLLFAKLAAGKGMSVEQIAASAGLGLTAGTALSFLYLVCQYLHFRSGKPFASQKETVFPDSVPPSFRSLSGALAKLAIPMTLGASALSATKLIDMAMILRRLQSLGMNEAMANQAYGNYTGLALSLFAVVPTLVNAVSLPLIPILSAAVAEQNFEKQKQMVSVCHRMVALFSIPASVALSAFSEPILQLLFGSDPQAVSFSAPLLSALGASVFLSCMLTVTNAVLHAYRAVYLPILSVLAGAAVKVVSAYFLIGTEQIGIYGAPVSTFLCSAVSVGLNLLFVCGLCKPEGFLKESVLLLLASLLSLGPMYFVYRLLAAKALWKPVLVLPLLLLSATVYLLMSAAFSVFKPEDIDGLPMGKQLNALLSRFHIIHKTGSGKDQNYGYQ